MQQKVLEFIVDDQFIRAPHYTVVADSVSYLVARFRFSEAWKSLEKTAVFHGPVGEPVMVYLENDTCTIPYEVIQPTSFLVSVFGGDRITTDRVMVEVVASGYAANGVPPLPATPDVYNQLLEGVAVERQLAQTAATAAAEKAEQCAALTASAEVLLEEAETVPNLVADAQEAVKQAAAYAASAEADVKATSSAVASTRNNATAAANSLQDSKKAANLAKTYAENADAAAQLAISAKETAINATNTAIAAKASALEYADRAATAAQQAENKWTLLESVAVTESTEALSFSFANMGLKELYFEGIVKSQDRSTVLQTFSIGVTRSATIWSGTGTFGNSSYPNVMTRGHLFLSPSNTLLCDATVSLYGYTLDGNGKSFTSIGRFNESAFTNINAIGGLYLKVAGGFAAGTSFRIWGR